MKPYVKTSAIEAIVFGVIMAILYVLGGVIGIFDHPKSAWEIFTYCGGCTIFMFLFHLWDNHRKSKNSK